MKKFLLLITSSALLFPMFLHTQQCEFNEDGSYKTPFSLNAVHMGYIRNGKEPNKDELRKNYTAQRKFCQYTVPFGSVRRSHN